MNDSIRLSSEKSSTCSSGVDERRLWEDFRAGGQQAYAEIYERFAPKLLSYGRKMTADQQLIEDAIQDLFIELWKGRANLSPTNSIQFYLFRALRNKLSRQFRAMPLENIEKAVDHASLLSQPFEALLIADEETTAQSETLRRAIQQLSPRQQEVVHLRYFQHFDSQQIAELIGINDQSVRNVLYTAIQSLRQVLTNGIIGLIISFLI